MTDPENPPAAPEPPPAGPPAEAPSPEEKPKDRRWFVALTWVTLVLFGLFIAGITLCSIFLPELKEAAGP